jgi:cell division protein FtsI/penicillin-binding protein 2
MALDLQKITPEETYTDPGTIFFGTQTIKNFDGKSNGTQTMTQVLEKSLNTGAVYIQQKVGKEKFKEYMEKFDFGKKTEIELPGELSGDIRNLSYNRDVNYATASFGQGISVTPIQFVKAASAVANRGIMMKPYIVEKKVFADGKEEFTGPEIVKQVISPEASSFLAAMMVSVVKNGHAKRAQIPGYFIAGKTGTAQVANTGAGGYSDQTIHSFFGFFPAFDPKYLIFIKIDKPQGIEFAESSAVPAFKDLAQYVINYYEIPPDYTEEEKAVK